MSVLKLTLVVKGYNIISESNSNNWGRLIFKALVSKV